MKKIYYIACLVTITLFSCSKEDVLVPESSSETISPDMIIISEAENKSSDTKTTTNSGNTKGDITDPEKEDREKTNKKAKN